MAFALLAIAALLLPWLAGYLAVGIVTAAPMLHLLGRRPGMRIDALRDTPVAIVAWPVVMANLALPAVRRALAA